MRIITRTLSPTECPSASFSLKSRLGYISEYSMKSRQQVILITLLLAFTILQRSFNIESLILFWKHSIFLVFIGTCALYI